VLDRLDELLAGEPSAETLDWLAVAAARYLDGESFEQAAGLNAVHPNGCRFAWRYRRMVRHLVAAAAMIPGSGWTRAKVLQSTIKLCRRRPGRAARNDIEREVMAALSTGPVPSSPQRLHGIIEANPHVRLFSDQPT